MNPKVDFYFAKAGQWQEAITHLRKIILSCGLTEVLKWGVPCYTYEERNIVLIHVFKNYCALLYFKGSLLHDAEGILVQQTEHVQAARQIRFTSAEAVLQQEAIIKAYTYEAIEIERAGLTVPLKKPAEFEMPAEFKEKLLVNPALQAAFSALTPGRQRGYLLYFAAPKQAKTRIARVEKYTPHILAGIGLNDNYTAKK